jgi:hypothetical protein
MAPSSTSTENVYNDSLSCSSTFVIWLNCEGFEIADFFIFRLRKTKIGRRRFALNTSNISPLRGSHDNLTKYWWNSSVAFVSSNFNASIVPVSSDFNVIWRAFGKRTSDAPLTTVSQRVKLEPSSEIIKRIQRVLRKKKNYFLFSGILFYLLGFIPVLNNQIGTPV